MEKPPTSKTLWAIVPWICSFFLIIVLVWVYKTHPDRNDSVDRLSRPSKRTTSIASSSEKSCFSDSRWFRLGPLCTVALSLERFLNYEAVELNQYRRNVNRQEFKKVSYA